MLAKGNQAWTQLLGDTCAGNMQTTPFFEPQNPQGDNTGLVMSSKTSLIPCGPPHHYQNCSFFFMLEIAPLSKILCRKYARCLRLGAQKRKEGAMG
eukprot:1141221-Pelagomonas_calceolata.AAC.2